VLQGTRQRVREFSSNLSLPTLLIYSLGILLPLVFVVILPVLSVIDLQVGLVQIALIYCVVLPLLVHLLSSNVLSKRPVIFQQLDHSIEPNWWHSAVKALAVSVPAPILCFWFAPAPDVTTLAGLWGIGLGLSAFLYFDSAPGYRRREEIVQMEREFSDALMQLGNRVSEGRPAEAALEHVAAAMSGSKIAQVFRAASTNVRLGGMGLRAALFEESRGALRLVGSSMIRGTLKMLLDLIEKSTRTAGEAILRTAQHLRELNEAKEEMRRSMAEVVTSMRAVAIFFAPLIVSIAARLQGLLSEKIPSLDLFPTTGISPAAFLFVLGLYTIILTIILTNYVVEIELGGDRLAKRMAVASAVPVALVVFTVGAILGGQMVDFLF
ncbi:MAG: type II secretion system F family protein, partial [Candidatus Hadarchaeum sp.]|uniref:type II secretion system F family protein n=1 Tax=Candidatus Hadarchaeum sp. TaxID=2883567 RepID=UPI003D0F9723